MPPIPIQTQNHSFSDSEITLALTALSQRQSLLSTTVIPQLSSLPATTSLLEQQRLSSSLRDDLDDFGRRVESLEQLVEDLRSPSERQVGRAVVEQWATIYAGLKKDARNAVLASKRTIDAHAKSRRDELLGSAVLKQNGANADEKTDDALMRTTATLTDALRRTEARLRAELDRSMLSTQLLTSQTATLRQTSDAHGRLGGLLETSKGLITALERTDWLDRVLIMTALAVFLLACAWIVKVRVFDRAVGIAFWWVSWLPSLSAGAEERMMEELERVARAVRSTAGMATSSASSVLSGVASAATQSLGTAVKGASSVFSEASATVTSSLGSVETLLGQITSEGLISTVVDALPNATSSMEESLSPLTTSTKTLASILRDEL